MHKLKKYLKKEYVINFIHDMYLDLQEQRKEWWALQYCDAEFYWKEELLIDIESSFSRMKSTLL